MGPGPFSRGQLDLGHHLHLAAITLHVQKDVLPYALCPVAAALASMFWMDSISTSYTFPLLIPSSTQARSSPQGRHTTVENLY